MPLSLTAMCVRHDQMILSCMAASPQLFVTRYIVIPQLKNEIFADPHNYLQFPRSARGSPSARSRRQVPRYEFIKRKCEITPHTYGRVITCFVLLCMQTLARAFNKTRDGSLKGDICRGAVLFNHGGYYMASRYSSCPVAPKHGHGGCSVQPSCPRRAVAGRLTAAPPIDNVDVMAGRGHGGAYRRARVPAQHHAVQHV